MSTSIFLNTCLSCNKRILASKNIFCIECNGLLPRTYFNFSDQNIVMDKLRALIKISAAGSFLFYNQNEMVQMILWEMKYNANKELAIEMGRLAMDNVQSDIFDHIDYILPIPLHSAKQRLRGYNQTEYFGKGLEEKLGIKQLENSLKRSKQTSSQTKLNRLERFENLYNAFVVDNTKQIEGKHILLIDDVITTGATLVSASEALYSAGISSLSIYTLACAFDS